MSTRKLDNALLVGTDDAFCCAISDDCQLLTSQHPTSDALSKLGLQHGVLSLEHGDFGLQFLDLNTHFIELLLHVVV